MGSFRYKGKLFRYYMIPILGGNSSIYTTLFRSYMIFPIKRDQVNLTVERCNMELITETVRAM